jgi:hypothetical protein
MSAHDQYSGPRFALCNRLLIMSARVLLAYWAFLPPHFENWHRTL